MRITIRARAARCPLRADEGRARSLRTSSLCMAPSQSSPIEVSFGTKFAGLVHRFAPHEDGAVLDYVWRSVDAAVHPARAHRRTRARSIFFAASEAVLPGNTTFGYDALHYAETSQSAPPPFFRSGTFARWDEHGAPERVCEQNLLAFAIIGLHCICTGGCAV